ncbi:glycoside hydrolase family 30 beta sandwich domain-containing protein [Microbacterium sp. AG238]|uniref:glycoside hydrolase family 30 protein n=1 Tax=Microbacterium sp. AG238 TaxID=2183994 RepID=UPI000FEF4DD9|nr:glycoside hydrolase family 30 beta sandwich domain-containing protein [Microbacterium sp. AG238]RKE64155.1 glucosylceramidase [Microbacterium sp. AG238]
MSETAAALDRSISWVSTDREHAWVEMPAPQFAPLTGMPNLLLRTDRRYQTVEGFGVCFNELGWRALSRLGEADRAEIFDELFTPGRGTGFSVCRMPVGANDFSTDWYSYDEVAGDFGLEHFSIEHDRASLIPYIHEALRRRPDLKLWASPWSPPSWMKTNGHYAAALPWRGSDVDNGLRPDQVGVEGTDMMIQEPRYLDAYAEYFARFVKAYRAEGIDISMVMPQNEFNSPQVFPSCTWTPEGLARFIAVLGPRMRELGVDVFFGTQERPAPEHLATVLAEPDAGPFISGAGFQWAGKGAIADAHRIAPHLSLYQTEQECGDGRNDWRFARYTWSLMRRFFEAGANAYTYWNLALDEGGVSRWGWAQNSLVVVDPATNRFRYTHEFFVMKHLAHHVQVGATRIDAFSWTGHENQLAFENPDGSIVIVMQNDLADEMPVTIALDGAAFDVVLPADSFSTIRIAAPA